SEMCIRDRAIACAKRDPALHVTILDLPEQLALARLNIEEAGLGDRVQGHGGDLLLSLLHIPQPTRHSIRFPV
ncbi:hypothetical protein ACQ4LF_25325, partial [Aeromonas salmonicida]